WIYDAVRRRRVVTKHAHDSLGDLRAETRQRRDGVRTCVANALQAAERLEQYAPLRFPDARNLEQLRRDGTHRPAFALPRHRGAVRLGPGRREHPGRRRPSRQAQWLRASEDEDLLLALCEADDRHGAKPERLERAVRRVELPFPAVDDDEIWQVLLLLDPSREI